MGILMGLGEIIAPRLDFSQLGDRYAKKKIKKREKDNKSTSAHLGRAACFI